MKFRANIKKTLPAVFSVILAACAGGETGTGFDAVSVGTITGFGSVFVNGIEFNTNDTKFTLEGQAGSEKDLKVGMVVFVGGSIDDSGVTGTADEIVLEEVLKGVVQSNDGSGSIVVLGQTVQLGANTKFDTNIQPNDITGINVNDVVEVSGHVISPGVIEGTRIEKLDSGFSEFQLTGYISNNDSENKTFDIGGLHVDYSGAEVENHPGNDILVRVKGTYNSAQQIFVAAKVNLEELHVEDADKIDIEGFVTHFVSVNEFHVNNIPVKTSSATKYEGGAAAEIAMGTYLDVEGSLVSGVLNAVKIEFHESVKLESNVDMIGMVNAHSMSLKGMGGINVDIISTTKFEGLGSDLHGMDGLNLMNSGDHVEIRGSANASGITASVIKVGEADNQFVLQGPVQSFQKPTITVLGFSINTDGIPAFSVDGGEDTQDGLFQVLEVNDLITLEGTVDSSGTVTWESLERGN